MTRSSNKDGQLSMILPSRCIGAAIVTLFPLLTFAEYFMNPPSFVNSVDGTQIKTQDLSTIFTLGQKVQITWFVPTLLDISLSVIHWGVPNDTKIKSFLTNEPNIGYYTWAIGIDDGVDLKMISASPNFGFQLEDPTGKLTSTGKPPGFIDSTLRSRGFVIQPNVTTSSSSSTLAPAPSTLSPSPESSVPSQSRTTSSSSTITTALANTTTAASARKTPPLGSGLSRSAVVGLTTGLCMASILALIAVLLLYFQPRLAKNVQAKNANLVVRTEEPPGVNSMRPSLQAGLNAGPIVAELSAFPSAQYFIPELGNSRLSRPDLGNLTLSRQELSAERFSNQELGNSTLSRQELSADR